MPRSAQSVVVLAWLLSVTLCAAVPQNDMQTKEPAQWQVRDEKLAKVLEDLVMKAEKKAKAQLPEKVTSAEQALKYVNADWVENYRVLEHKGWWIVAWQGSKSTPALWFYGIAIRKNSKDIYHFGSW
jgi:hypothetical protein